MFDKTSLTAHELDAQSVIELPSRDLMSLVEINFNELISVENVLNWANIKINAIRVDHNNVYLTVDAQCAQVNAVLASHNHTCA
jgi:hypothetical protein